MFTVTLKTFLRQASPPSPRTFRSDSCRILVKIASGFLPCRIYRCLEFIPAGYAKKQLLETKMFCATQYSCINTKYEKFHLCFKCFSKSVYNFEVKESNVRQNCCVRVHFCYSSLIVVEGHKTFLNRTAQLRHYLRHTGEDICVIARKSY